ncbi:hypothetical protein G6L68_25365 [Agrobacterium fabrum]|uniref:hypothetical protein n=1 Tax=Agrobacterium fabrum TaxID=1176649 RepID=UPI000EF57411|nr:hypothetical protein [Agrobacterium fabrum]AYM66219.1 hypothetical protein At12D13_50670 [Agrobacterium fabrum]NTE63964.1 hypothetical protein [Agrobacterium fabrum]
MTEEKKNKGGRPRKKPDPNHAEFSFSARKDDIAFVDAAAKRLGITRGIMIRRAVEAYVDPFARLQEAAKSQDRMQREMREMRSMFVIVKDMITKVALFITTLYAAEESAHSERVAESVRDDFLRLRDQDASPSIPEVEDDAAMGWETN